MSESRPWMTECGRRDRHAVAQIACARDRPRDRTRRNPRSVTLPDAFRDPTWRRLLPLRQQSKHPFNHR